MRLVLPKKIQIVNDVFTIKYDKKHAGGSFTFEDFKIDIGTMYLEKNPEQVFQVLSHEIMEIIRVTTNTRYHGYGTQGDYMFVETHKEFQTNIEIFSSVITKFIK